MTFFYVFILEESTESHQIISNNIPDVLKNEALITKKFLTSSCCRMSLCSRCMLVYRICVVFCLLNFFFSLFYCYVGFSLLFSTAMFNFLGCVAFSELVGDTASKKAQKVRFLDENLLFGI